MSAKLIPLKPHLERDQESAINTLKAILDQAVEGRVSGVGIAIVRPHGGIDTTFSGTQQGPALVGAITLLQHRILKNIG